MHQVDANDNEDLPGHDFVPAVGEVEHYTGDQDFGDGEPHVVLEVAVKVLVVVAEVAPPGVVVRISVQARRRQNTDMEKLISYTDIEKHIPCTDME